MNAPGLSAAPQVISAQQAPGVDIVLLHGWGCDSTIWQPLLAHLRARFNVWLFDIPYAKIGGAASTSEPFASAVCEILDGAPARAVYVGHSLGGKLAIELAQAAPDRVDAVVCLCANPSFVEKAHWPGMNAATFAEFASQAGSAIDTALRRFDALQARGTTRERALLRDLRRRRPAGASRELAASLQLLDAVDHRATTLGLDVPQLHIFAEADALVPVAAAAALEAQLASGSETLVHIVSDSGHLVMWEQPEAVLESLEQFLAGFGAPSGEEAAADEPPKQAIAASFSRAAVTYDSVAQVQRMVADDLLARLDRPAATTHRMLDLGCGTGYSSAALSETFPQADYVGLDLAQGMVSYARERHTGRAALRGDCHRAWLVGDAEELPLADRSIDLVFSSLALQWCYRPEALFRELHRILRSGGMCVFTTLGPRTLYELRDAWSEVDAHQHVNRFLSCEELLEAAARIEGCDLVLQRSNYVMRYARVRHLLDELKGIGAHNMNRGRQHGLTSRRALQGMVQAYERQRTNGTLPATYDVIFGAFEKR